jgi:hypothetical protein
MNRHREMVEIVEGWFKKEDFQVIVAPHARKKPYKPMDKEIYLYDRHRENGRCELSNADIAIPSDNRSMKYIIEIEANNVPAPKTLIGTIEATNYAQVCYIGQVKDKEVYEIGSNNTLLLMILDDQSNIGEDKERQINWIKKEYKFKPRNINDFKIYFLTDFKKMSRGNLAKHT